MQTPEPSKPEADRRPLKSRSWPVMGRLALGLARMGVTANQVSVAGLVFGVVAGGLLIASAWYAGAVGPEPIGRVLLVGAVVFIQLRLLCNLIDGMVAVEGAAVGRAGKSAVGVLYNELPDRISDAMALVGAGYAATGHIGLGWFAAVVAVMTAYVRAVGKAETGVNDFCGPMAKPHRMATLTVACLVAAVLPGSAHAAIFEAVGDVRVHLPGVIADAMAPRSAVEPSFGVVALGLVAIAVGAVWNCVRRTMRIARRLRSAKPLASQG